ncbi:MAG: DUF4347 domain-containing protein, partial [Gammaproteobacteria bacterium]|nr:DUF4347 domain-containing protein [Gammaproteobacteria bacterium]
MSSKRNHRQTSRLSMELMEPRMLLSADALALAGLPGVDGGEDDAPWEQAAVEVADLTVSAPQQDIAADTPLALDLFSDDPAAADDASVLSLLGETGERGSAGELLFVDSRVDDYQGLIEQIRAERAGVELQIYLLDAGRDGVQQIGESLALHGGVDALHIISHGAGGGLQLGASWLDGELLDARADEFGAWSENLGEGADLLLYGCDLAADAEGRALVDALAQLTGTDVAASDDATGHAALGGDWDLEYRSGTLETTPFGARLQPHWYATLDISSGLILHNSFDSDATDASGNGYDGTLSNGALIDTNGATNMIGAGKLSLDGADDFVDLSSHVGNFKNVGEGTIAAWVYHNASSFTTVFELSDSGDDDSRVVLGVSSNGTLGFGVFSGNSRYIDLETESGLVAKNSWTHIAVTVDSGGNKLYVNGAQVTTNLDYIDGSAASTEFIDDVSKLDYMVWGRDLNKGGYGEEYQGFIDDGRVYDRALSAADILELYSYGNSLVTEEISSDGAGSARAVAINASGEQVVVWSKAWQDGDGWGVYAQRYDNDGNALGATILVNQTTAGDQRHASVGIDAGGDFVVSWSGYGQDGTASSVYARQFNADGSAAGGEFRVNTENSGAQSDASLDVADDGSFIVVWEGQGPGDDQGVFFRRFNDDGSAMDANEIIAHTATDGGTSEKDPVVAWQADGKFVIAWEEESGNKAYFQRFGADGTMAGAKTQIDSGLSTTSGLSIDANASGAFAIAYKEEVTLPKIYARAFDADGGNIFTAGNWLGAWAGIGTSGSLNPSVAMTDAGEVLIAYQTTADGGDIKLQQLNANGSIAGATTVLVADVGDQAMPAIAALGTDTYAVAWNDASGVVTAAATVTINSAPLLADADPTLTSIVVNDFDSAGDSVAAIVVDGSISDADGATESIAVIAVDDSNGSWQYSSDGGGSWSNVDDGSLGADHALLLAAGDRLRFVPDSHFQGSASLTFRAWDGSSGSAGDYADSGAGGGSSAFSSASDIATIAVLPADTDGDGLWDHREDANGDGDYDPATSPGPDSDGDGTPNWLDSDDDDDGTPTSAENADPDGDGDPRDAVDSDHDGQPDWLDLPLSVATDGIVAATQKLSAATVAGLATVLDDEDRFGASVASIGDIDGDGVVDVAVGARSDDDGGSNRGAVHILFLNADGTVKAQQKISDTTGGLSAVLDDDDAFGRALAGIGDIDGDGINDIAVGANYDDDGGNDRGAVYILFLNSDGTVRAEQKISASAGGMSDPLSDNDKFGRALAGIGDIDGDGINDIAVGVETDDDGGTNHGAVYLLMLNADGTVKSEQKISDGSGGLTAVLDDGDRFGVSVAGLGDLDGDGNRDIAVGSLYDGGSDRGAVHILFLNGDGTVRAEQKISGLSGGLSAALDDGDAFGVSVVAVGDANGDGTVDILVGADADDDGGSNQGAAYLLFLNPDGTVKGEQKLSSGAGGLSANLDNDDWFGVSATGLGDLDGDGVVDLLIGAEQDDDGGIDRGALYLLSLQAENINSAPTLTATATNPTFTEGGAAVNPFSGSSASTVDAGQQFIRMTLTVSNVNDGGAERLTLGGAAIFLTDGATASTAQFDLGVSVSGTTATVTLSLNALDSAELQTLIDGMSYRNYSDNPDSSDRVVTLTGLSDSGGGDDSSTPNIASTISVQGSNDAPTLSGGPFSLGSTTTDNSSSGVQVATILAGLTAADVDGDTLGIAVSALSGNNLWQYSTDSSDGLDGSWQSFGAVADNSALLLDPNAWIRYQPDGVNAENPAVTFHAWDQSSGTASTGGSPSYGDPGSGSAFSSGSAQAGISVTLSNNPPSGSVTIDNISPTQGDMLTAANTLADADGIASAISYQWLRDGVAIAGANGVSYTTTQADVGTLIAVTASYTDTPGNLESMTSTATAAVVNANDPGVVTIDDTSPEQGGTLNASVSDTDGASGAISYQWYRNGIPIAGATGASYTTYQIDVGRAITVSATYSDDLGSAESPLSAATDPVANVNDAGLITIHDTTPTQGQMLIASIFDIDGASGPIDYQWYRDGVAIAGATGDNHTTTQADVGAVISVAASYSDNLGSAESLLSAATAAVTNVNDAGSVTIDDTTPTQGQTL